MSLRQSDLDAFTAMTTLCVEVAYQLPKFAKKADEFRRSGFPSSSVPEAISGTSEPILPGFDRVDGRLAQDEQAILAFLRATGPELQKVERILNSWLLVAPPLEDPYPCQNLECDKTLEAGLKTGECSRCRVWRHRHDGAPYPKTVEKAS